MAPTVPSEDHTAVKVVTYILFEWLVMRMKVAEIIPRSIFPLQFKSIEIIMNRHYYLEFSRDPFTYWLQVLNIRWLPHLDKRNPPECIPLLLCDKVVGHGSGFYRVITESCPDYEYLIRFHMCRV